MKNPLFSSNKKYHKHQKTQVLKCAKIPKKCMKTCNLMKKEGQKGLTLNFWRKSLKLWPRKWQKKFCEKGSREELERKTKNCF